MIKQTPLVLCLGEMEVGCDSILRVLLVFCSGGWLCYVKGARESLGVEAEFVMT